jgi:hypothetical protein
MIDLLTLFATALGGTLSLLAIVAVGSAAFEKSGR